MSDRKPTGRTRPSQVNHRTDTPGVYARNGYYIVLTRPDGLRKVRHRFETYADAVAFKAATPNRSSPRHSIRKLVGKRIIALTYLRNDPCSYCDGSGETLDHIVPRAGGGEDVWTNLTAACRPCNSRKQDTSLLLFLLSRQPPR